MPCGTFFCSSHSNPSVGMAQGPKNEVGRVETVGMEDQVLCCSSEVFTGDAQRPRKSVSLSRVMLVHHGGLLSYSSKMGFIHVTKHWPQHVSGSVQINVTVPAKYTFFLKSLNTCLY